MRVAAIDCGTNAIRLLIADVAGDKLVDVARRMEIVRLGEGVDRTGALVLLPVKNQDAPYAIGPAAYTARRQGNAAFGPVSHLEVTTVAPAGDGAAESGLMELSGGAYPVKQLIRVSGNPLFVAGGSHTRGLAEAMLGKITGLEYRESRFSWRGDPALEIGGRVALTDVSGKEGLMITVEYPPGGSDPDDNILADKVSSEVLGRASAPTGEVNLRCSMSA